MIAKLSVKKCPWILAEHLWCANGYIDMQCVLTEMVWGNEKFSFNFTAAQLLTVSEEVHNIRLKTNCCFSASRGPKEKQIHPQLQLIYSASSLKTFGTTLKTPTALTSSYGTLMSTLLTPVKVSKETFAQGVYVTAVTVSVVLENWTEQGERKISGPSESKKRKLQKWRHWQAAERSWGEEMSGVPWVKSHLPLQTIQHDPLQSTQV